MWFIKEEFLVKKSTGSSGLPAFTDVFGKRLNLYYVFSSGLLEALLLTID